MTTGYAGYYGTPGFQNKADALKYAMELSYRIDENGGYFLDKVYALNIYNFIIENVELPNTKEENMATSYLLMELLPLLFSRSLLSKTPGFISSEMHF